jgi:hypothetical protein
MSDRQGYINLQDPIHQYMDEAEVSVHKFYKLWNLAVRAMEELGLDAFFGVRTVILPVSGNKTATLPQDCLQWCKAGYFNSDGQVVALKRNTKLSNYAALHPDRIVKLAAAGVNLEDDHFYNFSYGETITNLYGLPPSSGKGTFNVDEAQGVIVLSPDCSLTELVLEYIPAVDQTQDLYIPIQFREAVISYLRWKDIISLPNSRKGTLGDKAQRRHEWFNDRRLAMARYKPFRAPEALDQNRDSQRKTIKQ